MRTAFAALSRSSFPSTARVFTPRIQTQIRRFTLPTVSDPTHEHVRPAQEGVKMMPYVLTVAGPDRVGIVHEISGHVLKVHGNFEESRMTTLGNDFAVIALVSLPETSQVTDFKQKLLEAFPGFMIGVRPTTDTKVFARPHKIFQLHAEGPDQAGIVRQITRVLREFNIPIKDMDTDTSSAPFAGYSIFSLKAVVAVPTSIDPENLMKALQSLEEELGIDISLEDPQQLAEESIGDEGKVEDLDEDLSADEDLKDLDDEDLENEEDEEDAEKDLEEEDEYGRRIREEYERGRPSMREMLQNRRRLRTVRNESQDE